MTRVHGMGILAAAATAVLLGCGGGGDSGGGPSPAGLTVAKAPSASGDGQSGEVGTPLAEPLRIIVTLDGAPQAGTAVTWSATGTGAGVDPASSTSGTDGIAATAWTLGQTAGPQSAQATVSGATGSPVTFGATALPGAPARIAATGGDGQFGELNTALAEPLAVEVTDAFGNVVSGVTVSWAVTAGSATLSSTTTQTSSSGIASVTVTLGSARGPVGVTASVAGIADGAASFSAAAVDKVIRVGNGGALVFVPSTATIPVGGSVGWVWNSGSIPHNVSTSTGSPTVPGTPSQTRPTPFTFGPVQFDAPGSYRFYCSVHAGPTDTQGMVGTLTVQ